MSKEPSFMVYLTTHEAVRESFLRHQEALLDRDLPEARRRLERHVRLLCDHIQEEEIDLLPIYGERAGRIEGGGVGLFTAEHRRFERMLKEFRDDLAEMRANDRALDRRILDLLDRQALYKHLLHHHDLRERNVLYPVLDRVTTPAERRKLIEPRRAARRRSTREAAQDRRKTPAARG